MPRDSRLDSAYSTLTRSRWRILLLSLGFGLVLWTVDAVLDWLFFYDATFLSLFITAVPLHELYVRTTYLAIAFLTGFVFWRLARDLRVRERDLRLFRRLIDESNDSVFVIDEETGRFLDVNRRACEVLGYDREELLEMGVPDIQAHIEDRSSFQRFIRSPEGREFKNKRFTHRRADGTTIPVEISASSVDVEDTTYRIAIARDISERVSYEEKMRESEEKYRSLFNSMRDAILVADTDRRILECNPAFTSLFGYELEEIRGKQTSYVYESEEEFRRLGEELAANDRDSNFFATVNYERKSGEVFPGETNVFYLLDDDDAIRGYVGLIRDVTRRVQQERQLKVIDRILRHNLRNDLNVIMGSAELIQEKTNGKISTELETIETTSRELIDLADTERRIVDLLTGDTDQVALDLGAILDDIVATVRADYPETSFDLSTREEVRISGVPMFGEALEELVVNAAKHCEREETVVSVETIQHDGTVTIRVSDNGSGLPEADVKVLLGTEDLDPISHGSGLGLWLVNLIVTRSNGSLEYEFEEGGGATVDVIVPMAEDAPQ